MPEGFCCRACKLSKGHGHGPACQKVAKATTEKEEAEIVVSLSQESTSGEDTTSSDEDSAKNRIPAIRAELRLLKTQLQEKKHEVKAKRQQLRAARIQAGKGPKNKNKTQEVHTAKHEARLARQQLKREARAAKLEVRQQAKATKLEAKEQARACKLEAKCARHQGGRRIVFISESTTIPTSTGRVEPGGPIRKIWKVRNDSTESWPEGSHLLYVGGRGSQALKPRFYVGDDASAINPSVPRAEPGQEVDLIVNIVAPEEPGQYIGIWRMCDATGDRWGPRLWTQVTVPGGPATDSPAQCASSGCEFKASTLGHKHIPAGYCCLACYNSNKDSKAPSHGPMCQKNLGSCDDAASCTGGVCPPADGCVFGGFFGKGKGKGHGGHFGKGKGRFGSHFFGKGRCGHDFQDQTVRPPVACNLPINHGPCELPAPVDLDKNVGVQRYRMHHALVQLVNSGFTNQELNRRLLIENQFDIVKTLEALTAIPN